MVTIKEIAERCGVSITTVSRVLNNKGDSISEKTKERIFRVVDELNYVPNAVARSMVTKRTNNIALIVPDISNPFFADIAKGAERTCVNRGFHLFLCNSDMDKEVEKEYIRVLRKRLVDGMIITTQNTEEYDVIFEEMLEDNYPFVFIERYSDKLADVPGVFAGNMDGAYNITKHLIELGHKDIAFITGPLVTSNARYRLEGYQRALKDHDLPVNPKLIRNGNYKVAGGYRETKTLLEQNIQFSALFASNDLMAFGAYQAVKEYGLEIPEQLSIVGFDNIDMPGVIEPQVTTMDIPAYEMAVKAVTILLDLIEGRTPKESKVYYPLKLVNKGSTAPKKEVQNFA